MKLRTTIIGLLITLFFVSNVHAFGQVKWYRWGMKKAEAVAALQRVMLINGLKAKEEKQLDDTLILRILKDGSFVGNSALRFDRRGGLIATGILLYANTEKEAMNAYKRANEDVQYNTDMKLKAASHGRTIYQNATDQATVFVIHSKEGVFAMGVATSKL